MLESNGVRSHFFNYILYMALQASCLQQGDFLQVLVFHITTAVHIISLWRVVFLIYASKLLNNRLLVNRQMEFGVVLKKLLIKGKA
jgi:hypothetical protein